MAINGISLVIVSRAERGRDVDAISSRRSAERVERETVCCISLPRSGLPFWPPAG